MKKPIKLSYVEIFKMNRLLSMSLRHNHCLGGRSTEVMKGHDLSSKAKDWFLYDRDDRHEKVN